MTAKKHATPTASLDPRDDAPELDDAFFERADEFVGTKLVRRGRPPVEQPKVLTSIRYDADIVAYFKGQGPGWQTRMNEALRTVMFEAKTYATKAEAVERAATLAREAVKRTTTATGARRSANASQGTKKRA